MNFEQVKQDIISWIENFLEKSNSNLGNWAPCPYARQARINNNISIKLAEIFEFDDVIRESLETLDNKEVVIICFDHHTIDPISLQHYVKNMNNMLLPTNYVILEDHPNSPEHINDVCMNFGKCGLLLIQKLDKLNSASNQLREKGYYDHWSLDNLNDVVNWRYK